MKASNLIDKLIFEALISLQTNLQSMQHGSNYVTANPGIQLL